jgi:hypothetical protein
MRRGALIAALALAAGLAACSSSTNAPKVSSPASSTGNSPSSATPSPGSSAASGPLPSPCALVTKAEAAQVLGTAVTDCTPSAHGAEPGRTDGGYSAVVGVSAKNLGVSIRANYSQDPAYALVCGNSGEVSASGIGDTACYTLDSSGNGGTITVRKGPNEFDITVDAYDHPVSASQLETLARNAATRL